MKLDTTSGVGRRGAPIAFLYSTEVPYRFAVEMIVHSHIQCPNAGIRRDHLTRLRQTDITFQGTAHSIPKCAPFGSSWAIVEETVRGIVQQPVPRLTGWQARSKSRRWRFRGGLIPPAIRHALPSGKRRDPRERLRRAYSPSPRARR